MKSNSLSLVDLHSLYALIIFFRKNLVTTYLILAKNEEIKFLVKILNDFYKDLNWTASITKSSLINLANLFNDLNLANTNFSREKNPRNQLRFYHIILKILMEILPKKHPTMAFLYHKIGLIYLELKDKIAIEYLETALAIYHRLSPTNHAVIEDLQANLRRAYQINTPLPFPSIKKTLCYK